MPARPIRSMLCVLAVFSYATTAVAEETTASDSAALELFSQRIMPIFQSPNPSSCVQCHLAAVDLKNYILPSHEETFASLRVQGLVDLDHPRKSKILTLIDMGERDADKGARLIHEKTRRRIRSICRVDRSVLSRRCLGSPHHRTECRTCPSRSAGSGDPPCPKKPRGRFICTERLVTTNALFPLSHSPRD